MHSPIENYNSDNILIRNVIAGVLSILNKSIKYTQVWDNNIKEVVTLPWMYDLGTSDERLMQDNYTFFGSSCFAKKIDGKFDMFPRGAIRLESTTIDSDNICNRFVQGLTTRVENGKIQTYHSFLYSIPLTVTFNCEIWVDNFTNMLKIEQAIREYLYRNKTFYVLFRGMRIGCCLGMPNDYNEQKNTEYSLSSENGEQKIKLTFQLVVETYQPVFDKTMETPSDKLMKGVGFDVKLNKHKNNKKIKLYCDNLMVAGTQTHIYWDYYSDISDMCTVNIEYKKVKDKNGNELDEFVDSIVIGLSNQSDYYWNVPDKDTINQFDIIYDLPENIKMLKEPIIKIIYDGKLDKNSFIIIDPGYFITDSTNGISSVNFSIGYMSNKKYKVLSDFGSFNLLWSKIDLTDPVNINNPLIDDNISIDKTEYEIKIYDSVDNKIYDVISGIKIY